jgi:hypothetical protein
VLLNTSAPAHLLTLQVGPNPTLILLSNCPEIPGILDVSCLAPTQECAFREFANSPLFSRESINHGGMSRNVAMHGGAWCPRAVELVGMAPRHGLQLQSKCTRVRLHT